MSSETFTETDRHLHPLTPDSWVLEIGAHQGKDAQILARKYGCQVICYEPVKEFFDAIIAMMKSDATLNSLLRAFHSGIGATAREETFGVKGELSGIVCSGNRSEKVTILPIDRVLKHWFDVFGHGPDLMNLNVESMEYEILEAILDRGMESQIARLQVQPHSVVPMAEKRWAGIRNRLLMNFRILAEHPAMDIGWTIFERK